MSDLSRTVYSCCLTTVSKEDEAQRLANLLIENHLAACVNLIPGIKSIYRWKSKIEQDQEILLLIKTRRDQIENIIDFLKKNHSYELPELIELPILNGHLDYLKWIDENLQENQTKIQ